MPGLWDVSLDVDVDPTANARRNEPNIRMNAIATAGGFLDDGLVLGLFDNSVPQGDYSGWAKFGVSWNFASAGTPGHEAAHSAGLNHVNCLGDTDGDGISQEDEGGAIDWDHPTMLPPVCSLAPIDPDGYFGFTNYHSPVVIYSNDPAHPLAAFPFMGYKTPKWTDPYDWCLLLDTFGVPCDPASIGVPPTPHIVDVDCDPEPIGPGGFQLDLCVGTDLPGGESPYHSGVEVTVADVAGSQTLTLVGGETDFQIPLEPLEWVMVGGRLDESRAGHSARCRSDRRRWPGVRPAGHRRPRRETSARRSPRWPKARRPRPAPFGSSPPTARRWPSCRSSSNAPRRTVRPRPAGRPTSSARRSPGSTVPSPSS